MRTILLAVLVLSTPAFAADPLPGKKCFHLDAAGEKAIGYCQAVRIGDTLHISGSVGAGEMKVAMAHAYDEIRQTLQAHGLSFRNVVKENLYTTRLDEVIRNQDLRRKYYVDNDFPAATWVQVQRLYDPSLVVEVEVTAVFPPGK
ncbi:RidA family protein [Piscinibacter terrae]|uniref:RidA family protein n=1 Tax=Piscinibacter terrae TaxID=2496871 RepID=A0A3N7HQS8_9BURK|nr:RidA family protein [Albitalea terrae]RQP23131.1 RidA family protein [Albitalea terrae]